MIREFTWDDLRVAAVKRGLGPVDVAQLVDLMKMIDRLRDGEGDAVAILCDNPDGSPNNAVECCGAWTEWEDRRFEGASLYEALSAAVATKNVAEARV
jgi:hypothetical protein